MAKNVALLVAESPWFSPKSNIGQASGLPFFEGVKKLLNTKVDQPQFNIYSCNYYDNKSLESALDHLVNTSESRQVLYLGGHGDGKNVANATLKTASQLIRDRGKKIKGLILSSCWGGLTDKIADSTQYGFDPNSMAATWVNGPNWVISYRHPVSWFESAMIETSIVKTFCDAYRYYDINSRDAILDRFEYALRPFCIKDPMAYSDEELCISVEETIRVWIRPQGAEYPKEVTEELFSRLQVLQGYE
ncbi:hypothetical protein BIZ37_23310 [Photobacterium sp. BZF1]|uniref:hypothetical protein n=1 Tax=Photobacterium sp. BZF1 TaxID=1904457 RepID=UPI00165366C9|nr:hypothetical protein [Photobacterium sp. BZF1]MBC7005491.1 hypothetical protein [Photobacterium sp. BZF1]